MTRSSTAPPKRPVFNGILLAGVLLSLNRGIRWRWETAFAVLHAVESCNKAIVFSRGDGVKLVVVTPCTVDRHPQKRLTHRAGKFFQFIMSRGAFHRRTSAE